jgi:hypothetical protein
MQSARIVLVREVDPPPPPLCARSRQITPVNRPWKRGGTLRGITVLRPRFICLFYGAKWSPACRTPSEGGETAIPVQLLLRCMSQELAHGGRLQRRRTPGQVFWGELTRIAGAIPRCSDHSHNIDYRELPSSWSVIQLLAVGHFGRVARVRRRRAKSTYALVVGVPVTAPFPP